MGSGELVIGVILLMAMLSVLVCMLGLPAAVVAALWAALAFAIDRKSVV